MIDAHGAGRNGMTFYVRIDFGRSRAGSMAAKALIRFYDSNDWRTWRACRAAAGEERVRRRCARKLNRDRKCRQRADVSLRRTGSIAANRVDRRALL